MSTGVMLLLLDQVGEVIADIAGALGRDERIDVAPFLRPHVAEQIGADRAGRGLDRIAIFLVELGADVGVERHVERLHFLPQPLGLGGELLGRHVIARAPHRAGVAEAEFLGAVVGDRRPCGHSRSSSARRHCRASWSTSRRVRPGVRLMLPISASMSLPDDRLAVQRALALAILRLEVGRDGVELGRRARRGRRGQDDAVAQDVELALGVGARAPGRRRYLAASSAYLTVFSVPMALILRGQRVGVVGDVGRVDPVHLAAPRPNSRTGPFRPRRRRRRRRRRVSAAAASARRGTAARRRRSSAAAVVAQPASASAARKRKGKRLHRRRLLVRFWMIAWRNDWKQAPGASSGGEEGRQRVAEFGLGHARHVRAGDLGAASRREARRPGSGAEPLSWSSVPHSTSVGMVKAASHSGCASVKVGSSSAAATRSTFIVFMNWIAIQCWSPRLAVSKLAIASTKKCLRAEPAGEAFEPHAGEHRAARPAAPRPPPCTVVRAPSEKPPRS